MCTEKEDMKTMKDLAKALTMESSCICCQPVNNYINKDEALFCSAWYLLTVVNRYFAGVSVNAFQSVKGSSSPFFCFGCHQICSDDEVQKIKNGMHQLNEELCELKKVLSSIYYVSVFTSVFTSGYNNTRVYCKA